MSKIETEEEIENFARTICAEIKSLQFICENEVIFNVLAWYLIIGIYVYQSAQLRPDRAKQKRFQKTIVRFIEAYNALDIQSRVEFEWDSSKDYHIDMDHMLAALRKTSTKRLKDKPGSKQDEGLQELAALLRGFWEDYVADSSHCVFDHDIENSPDGIGRS